MRGEPLLRLPREREEGHREDDARAQNPNPHAATPRSSIPRASTIPPSGRLRHCSHLDSVATPDGRPTAYAGRLGRASDSPAAIPEGGIDPPNSPGARPPCRDWLFRGGIGPILRGRRSRPCYAVRLSLDISDSRPASSPLQPKAAPTGAASSSALEPGQAVTATGIGANSRAADKRARGGPGGLGDCLTDVQTGATSKHRPHTTSRRHRWLPPTTDVRE